MSEYKVEPKRVVANIYALAKARNVKIGELEQAAGVSAGYLSRLNREGNTTMPSVDMLHAIAEKLNVTVDLLISSDISGMTKGERYILSFLDKVIRDTADEELEWIKESKFELKCVDYDYETGAHHPLFNTRPGKIDKTSGYPDLEVFYDSSFTGTVSEIGGDCYHTELPYSNALIYLMQVDCVEDFGGSMHKTMEVYVVKDGVKEPLCRTYDSRKEISDAISRLFRTIVEVRDHIGVSKKARGILDYYMNEEEEIPF